MTKRGLHGVKLVISDAHDGLRLAITRVLGATWQRCRVHWMRNALTHVQKGQHTMVAAAIRQAFLQTDAEAAYQTCSLIDEIRLVPDKDHLNIELRGELAGILALAMDRKKPGDLSAAGHAQQIKTVAGTRNHRQFMVIVAV